MTMRIIVDANIIISALIRDSATRRILLHPRFDFYAPEYIMEEIERHKDLISKKAGLSIQGVDTLISLMFDNIKAVGPALYKDNISKAHGLIGAYDENDVPFVALALSIPNSGIWTNDNHFSKQDRIRIWKTEDLIEFIR